MSTNCLTSGICLLARYEVACGTLYTPIALSKNSAKKSCREDRNYTNRHEFREPSNPWCKFVKLVSSVCSKCGAEIPADAPEGGCPGGPLESGLRLLDEEAVAGVGLSAVAAYSAEATATPYGFALRRLPGAHGDSAMNPRKFFARS